MPSYRTLNHGLIHVNNNKDLELDDWANTLMDDCLKKWLELRYIELKHGGVLSFNIATSPHLHNLINEAWEKLLSNTNIKHEELAKVNIPVFNRVLGQSEKVINSISEKFKLVKGEVMENWVQFTRSTFNALFYNQIISGLSNYPQRFCDLKSMEQFYTQLENEFFEESEFISVYFEFELFLLQKL
ncbi:hypothetical protein CONCODRAFT_13223 [Conidiobolus coronatus NRRL 28638]|uniref:Uncharacterized protein n=1 Tax=Conidiobolus coronatus (strain ATCC 28846 / CBS 209.66 / NRRL 28638) TaxID=796925 RepID=A0A137NR54_CONC2|nr:hypothetical protein CONCODRAFT_13223 [Conidiobolus coronatus NRRL 28638]|eukprot:KXN65253.1 hypothetical protein CONCODRAFT_13223 [Conidiobolus coronatus NRRL 28638]